MVSGVMVSLFPTFSLCVFKTAVESLYHVLNTCIWFWHTSPGMITGMLTETFEFCLFFLQMSAVCILPKDSFPYLLITRLLPFSVSLDYYYLFIYFHISWLLFLGGAGWTWHILQSYFMSCVGSTSRAPN